MKVEGAGIDGMRSLNPQRSRCQDGILNIRTLWWKSLYERKWTGGWRRLGEPSDHNESPILREGEREV